MITSAAPWRRLLGQGGAAEGPGVGPDGVEGAPGGRERLVSGEDLGGPERHLAHARDRVLRPRPDPRTPDRARRRSYWRLEALKRDGASLVTIAHEEIGVGGRECDGARLQITATEPAKLPRAIDLVYPKLARVYDTGRQGNIGPYRTSITITLSFAVESLSQRTAEDALAAFLWPGMVRL